MGYLEGKVLYGGISRCEFCGFSAQRSIGFGRIQKKYGGNGLADDTITHFTNSDKLYAKDHKGWLMLYIPARSAVVLRRKE